MPIQFNEKHKAQHRNVHFCESQQQAKTFLVIVWNPIQSLLQASLHV